MNASTLQEYRDRLDTLKHRSAKWEGELSAAQKEYDSIVKDLEKMGHDETTIKNAIEKKERKINELERKIEKTLSKLESDVGAVDDNEDDDDDWE